VRVAYFDCISGISGDMALGALIAAGADVAQIRAHLATLPVEPFGFEIEEIETHGIGATRVHVMTQVAGVIRTYANIRSILDDADLPEPARATAHRIFRRLAEAEAIVHRRDVEQVTFHEIGAVDSIVDITGTALALHLLGIERVFSSPVPTGFGMAKTEHGSIPIPAPAVVELLRGAPLYSRGVPMELVTPTGAAILATLVEGYGDMPMMRTESVGYGSGIPRQDFPNLLRVIIGEEEPHGRQLPDHPPSGDVLLETNVDDLNPELYAYVLERLFDAGAQDAWLTPIIMKKGRPAVTIGVLCATERQDAVRRVLFTETGTLGVRAKAVERTVLEREWLEVSTSHGRVAVKIGILEGEPVTIAPEYDDCARVARASGVPARDVYQEAAAIARAQLRGEKS
jgi:TIGR00299 family protein